MKKILNIVLVASMVFGLLVGLPQAKAAFTGDKAIAQPNTCETAAAYAYVVTINPGSNQVKSIQLDFSAQFQMPAVQPPANCVYMITGDATLTYGGQLPTSGTYTSSSVTLAGSSLTAVFPYVVVPSSTIAQTVTFIVGSNSGIINPLCVNCAGPHTLAIRLFNEFGTPDTSNPQTRPVTITSKTNNLNVTIDPPTVTSTYSYGTSGNRFIFDFRLGTCGALVVGQTINLIFPLGTQGISAKNYDTSKIMAFHDPSPPVALPAVPPATPVVISSAVGTYNNSITLTIGTAIPANDFVRIVLDASLGISTPYTSGYHTFSVYTASEMFITTNQNVFIADHITVEVSSNGRLANDAQYKLKWKLPSNISLSGANNDYVDVTWLIPSNPGPDVASISNNFTALNKPQPASVVIQPYVGGQIYYALDVEFINAKTLRIRLPLDCTINAMSEFVITFLPIAHLNNTSFAGTYRLQMATNKVPVWIPSDYYAIVDGLLFDQDIAVTPSVIVNPPTTNKVGQYDIRFRVGPNGGMSGIANNITIFFPTGTTVPSSIGAGSVWIDTNPLAANAIFDTNEVECPPRRGGIVSPTARQLELNPTISYANGGMAVTLTLPAGFTIANSAYVTIRFCATAGITNPYTAGVYTLQIKTSMQPNYVTTGPYIISTAISNLTVKPTPDSVCSSKVQYEIQFNIGQSGSLYGNAGDYVELDFTNGGNNPAPDFASIQNTFNPDTAVTDFHAYSSPPFTGAIARYDMWFRVGTIGLLAGDWIEVIFPPTVTLPTSFPANSVYMGNAANTQMEILDTAPPAGGVDVTAATTIQTGNRVRIISPYAATSGQYIYIRFRSNAAILNPTAPSSSYAMQVRTQQQRDPVSTYFGIVNDYMAPGGAPPSVSGQWASHQTSLVVTPINSSTSTSAQYDMSVQIAADAVAFGGASTLTLQFPPGTTIPSVMPAGTVRAIASASPAFPPPGNTFGPDGTCGAGVALTATCNQATRTVTLTGFPAAVPSSMIHIRFCNTAGIINPPNSSISNQIQLTLTGSGSVGDGISAMSEFYAITPPMIGGVGLPPNSVRMSGGYFWNSYATSGNVSRIDVLGPKTVRLWLPPDAQFQSTQTMFITFTDVANLVNTCQAGSYKIRARTSKEPAWIESAPYAIVDSVQFTCGTYPRVVPPTVNAEAMYEISFTVGTTGGLAAGVDTISVYFPSLTQLYGNISAGSIYVSTLPMGGDVCPPTGFGTPLSIPPTISGTTVTFVTPIPVGNSQTVFVRFCKSANIKNPYTAGSYKIQVKTSTQPNYASSCFYGIGTAVSSVEVIVAPNSACNLNPQYEIKMTLGQSGDLKGENSDFIDIDFADPSNLSGTASIQNNFLNPADVPSPSSINVTSGYYFYGSSNLASMVRVLSATALRIYVPTNFTAMGSSMVTVVFTPGAGLRNTCTPGQYRLRASTSKELTPVSSKPYEIVDAVTFLPGIPVQVVPSTVSVNAQYTITFRQGPAATLNANTGTITIAFPSGTTVPYSMSGGTIWIARVTQFTNTTCPPTHAGIQGVDFAPVILPPTVSSQNVTITTPITINPGELISVRFCKSAGLKNPYTAGAYTLQVKTSAQPAFATSYPYAITSAISNIKVFPNPNTTCSENVEYKIEFQNSQSGALDGAQGDYIEVDFQNSVNPLPDLASIQNNFAAGGSVTDLVVRPPTPSMVGYAPRWDISFMVGATGALNPGSTVTIVFPASTIVNNPGIPIGAGAYISTQPWTNYPYTDLTDALSAGVVTSIPAANIAIAGTTMVMTMPAGVAIPNNGRTYVRLFPGSIFNPTNPGNTYNVNVSTSVQPTVATSNYFAVVGDRLPAAIPPTSIYFDNFGIGGPPPFIFPPRAYPQQAGAIAQMDFTTQLVCNLATALPQVPTLQVTLPPGYTVPAGISASQIYLAVNQPFLTDNDPPGNQSGFPPNIPGSNWGNPTANPVVTGNTISIQIPPFLQPMMVGNAVVFVRIMPSANIRNPVTPGVNYALGGTSLGNDPCGLPGYGSNTSSEYFGVTPAINPATSTSLSPSGILLQVGSASYASVTGVNPSSVVVLANKRVRIYLPLGFQIPASSIATVTFLPSSKLTNTCTPGNYILTMLTSKEPTDIESAPYTIVAAVSDINVKVVPPIVSLNAGYTITFRDTSTTGLKKNMDTISIAFPTGTTVPTQMGMGTVYVARNADFSNETCPPTHAGTYGIDWASLTAMPQISGQIVTITLPIDILAGQFIAIRFCPSAGLKNPANPDFYRLQVRTSAQPDYANSNKYSIVTGVQRPVVTVVPNAVSRDAGIGPCPTSKCVNANMTIAFTNGTVGNLARGVGKIWISMEMATVPGGRGYNALPPFIPANSIRVNGTICTVQAPVYNPPTGNQIPNPRPSFNSLATIEITVPVDIAPSAAIKVEFLDTTGICNPLVGGNYTVSVWTDVETAAIESEPYSIVDGVMVVGVDVQPPTINLEAQYTIELVNYANLTQGVSTITVTFPEDTTVPSTMLPGHIYLDNDNNFGNDPLDPFPPKAALNPVSISGKSITFTVPFNFPQCGALFIRFSVESGIKNPTTAGSYKLKVRTSSQQNDVDSPYYNIIVGLAGAIVTVTPPIANYVNAQYDVDFNLSEKGGLRAHVSFIKLTFPNADINGQGGGYATIEAQLPASISQANVSINGTILTEIPSVNLVERSITFITPISIEASKHVTLSIKPGAGMKNPLPGSYRLLLQTSVEPIDIQTEIYSITSALGGPLFGRNPMVNVSYAVAFLTQAAVAGDTTIYVDSTMGWVNGAYAVIGDLGNLANSQVIRLDSTNGVGPNSLLLDALYPLAGPWPTGTPVFMLKALQASQLTALSAGGSTVIQVLDARPFLGETYILVGPLNATAELLRIAPNGVDILTNTITLARPTIYNHPATDFVFKFANNIGLVNNESYYQITFQTGAGGLLSADISQVTIYFPFDTIIPDTIPPDAVRVSNNSGLSYQACTTVTTNPKNRTVTLTMPVNVDPGGRVDIVFLPRTGIRNPSAPGTYRLKVSTTSEPTPIDSLAYYMEGTGAPVVTVNPCTVGEVGADYKIKFRITASLPVNGHIIITFPQDTVLPSVLRQETVLVNGMKVVAPITVTTGSLTVDLQTPKALAASQLVEVEFTPEARIKHPSSSQIYRLKIRTSASPDNVDIESLGYFICPKVNLASVVLIPSSLVMNPGQTSLVQVQAKDENGNNITYNVSYTWSTDVGTISSSSGDSVTLTAPNAAASGTITCKATYNGKTLQGTCAVTVSAPLSSVEINPVGPVSLNFGASTVFSATAKDASGNVMPGATFKWSITNGIGSLSTSVGNSVTFTAGNTQTTGSVAVEATAAGVSRTTSATVQVVQTGGTPPGGGGTPPGGGGGTTTQPLVTAMVDPMGSQTGDAVAAIMLAVTALKDLSGGEIRITLPNGFQPPSASNSRLQPEEGVTIGVVTYVGQTIVIPISTMAAMKKVSLILPNPILPTIPGSYLFNVLAKQSTGDPYTLTPSPAYQITERTGVIVDGTGLCSITPSTASAGSTGAKFQFTFTARADMTNGEVQIQIPLDWTAPNTSPGTKGQVTLKTADGEIAAINVLAGGVISVVFGKFLNNHKFILDYTNVEVPTIEKKYTFNVLTGGKGSIKPKPIASQPTVDVVKTTVTSVICTPKPNSAGGPAQYQITFKTSDAGTMLKDLSTITIQFPPDTFVPLSMTAVDIKVQGVPLIGPPSINQSARTITITVPTDVPPNATCSVLFETSAGLKNPTTPKTYRITMWTSSDGSSATSSPYEITASTISTPKVTPDPVVVSVEANYTITFTTGGSGRLSITEDQIVIKFPSDTYLPPNINATSVTVNGKPLTKRPDLNTVARKVSLYVPEPIGENAKVTIVFDKSAGIKNPTKSGNYTLFVSTTKETIEVESDAYGIGSSTVTNVKVTPASNNAGTTCVDYTIEFTTGQFGGLTPASTITVWFHPNYKLGSIEARRITVNGMGVNETPEVKQSQFITFKVPGAINAGSNVKVLIQCIDNPTTAGTYFIKASTSAEPTQIQSNNYNLGETVMTNLTIAPPNPNGDNGWYNSKPSIILSCNVINARSYYAIDGGQAVLYTGAPVQIDDGIHRIEYWSEAAGYDTEKRQVLQNLKVDTIKPVVTVTSPKSGEITANALLKITGTFDELNPLRAVGKICSESNESPLTIDKTAKTFSGNLMLQKGVNQLCIDVYDEAGNKSFSAPITITYDPENVTQLQMIVTNPKEGDEPTYGVTLVNEAQIDYHHIEMKCNVQGTATGEGLKIEVSSEMEPGKWVQVPYDTIRKNFNSDVTLKAKSGDCKISIRATDKNGKTEVVTKTLKCKVRLEFVGIKGWNTVTDKNKPLSAPTKSLFNGSPISNLSAYPFVSELGGGKAYIPFRFIGNAFGAKVDYNAATRTAIYEFEGKRVEHVITTSTFNLIQGGQSKTYPLDTGVPTLKSIIINGKTFVPLRFFETAFGWVIGYDSKTKTVTVNYPR